MNSVDSGHWSSCVSLNSCLASSSRAPFDRTALMAGLLLLSTTLIEDHPEGASTIVSLYVVLLPGIQVWVLAASA